MVLGDPHGSEGVSDDFRIIFSCDYGKRSIHRKGSTASADEWNHLLKQYSLNCVICRNQHSDCLNQYCLTVIQTEPQPQGQ